MRSSRRKYAPQNKSLMKVNFNPYQIYTDITLEPEQPMALNIK